MNAPLLSLPARRLYQLLLRTVVESEAYEAAAAFPDVSDVRVSGNLVDLGELVDAGLIEYDTETGLVNAVLPLVAEAPSTSVELDDEDTQELHAAGVLDAFALAPLLVRRVRVHDQCPTCREWVQVLTDPDRIRRRQPRSAVVVRVPADDSRQGRYDTARLACSPEHAQAALEASGNPDAVMQSIEGLFIEACEQYGALIAR